jgi:uncharacterized repeat protein (TIGR02543 family)
MRGAFNFLYSGWWAYVMAPLPDFNDTLTLSFWAQINNEVDDKEVMTTLFEDDDSIAFVGILGGLTKEVSFTITWSYDGNDFNDVISGGSMALDTWYHIIVVFDRYDSEGKRFRLYINDVLVDYSEVNDVGINSALYGMDFCYSTNNQAIKLDDIILSQLGLSDGQISTIDDCETLTAFLSISSTAGGDVNVPGEGNFEYDINAVVNIEAEANDCYHFASWTGTGAGMVADVNAATTTVTMSDNYTLIANFDINTVILNASAGAGGEVNVPGEGEFEYDCGEVVAIAAIADAGYDFVNWTGTAAGNVTDVNDATTTVTVDDDYTLIANFAAEEGPRCLCRRSRRRDARNDPAIPCFNRY